MSDWREEHRNLYKKTLSLLHKEKFAIHDGEILSAQKNYATSKSKYEIIYEFPIKYPFDIIRAYLDSKELLAIYLKRPIKHLTLYKDSLLSICLKGAWNHLDFTDIRTVEKEALRWIKEYENNETFPDDFDLPENTLFFPLNEKNFAFYIYKDFFDYDIFKEGYSGTFEFFLSINHNVALLVGMSIWTGGSGGTISQHITYSLPDANNRMQNLFFQRTAARHKGIWQYSPIPPSPFAFKNNQFDIPKELQKFYWKEEIVKNKKSYCVMPDDTMAFLFLFELFGKKEGIMVLPKVHDAIEQSLNDITYLRPHIISDEKFFSRSGGLLSFDQIKHKKVCVMGLGALGSQTTLCLARMGVQNFTLVDRESLSIENVMRHACDLEDVNLNKTDAVAKKIGKLNPNAKFNLIPKNILSEEINLNAFGEDLFVSALADDATERFLNKELIKANKTAVYGRTTTTSYACRIFRVRPKIDACLECLSQYSFFEDIRYIQLNDENLKGKKTLVKFNGCTAPSYVGVNLDISSYANIFSKVIFDVLELGNEKFYTRSKHNHFVYSARLVEEEPKIKNTHTLIENSFSPLKGCKICGDESLPFSAIVIDENVIKKIQYLASKSKGKETGGILIGTLLEKDDQIGSSKILIVTHCTKPGPKAKRASTYFDRDVNYCTSILKNYHKKSKGQLNYVGEWHTHPSSDVRPSNVDDASLKKITTDLGYKVEAPLSIIQSNNSNAISYTVYFNEKKYSENLIVSNLKKVADKISLRLIKDIES